jgi:alpha-beta hydrolase superfamily lysophospholipase
MMTTTCTQYAWASPEGDAFSYSLWETDAPCRGVIVAVHGLSGAALDYEPLGRHFVGHGLTTYAPELRGQGNDPQRRRRGDLRSLDEWFADLQSFLDLVRSRHPSVPLFCYGESMGAALLTRFFARAGARRDVAGLILASPVIALPRRPALWQRAVFQSLLAVAPRLRINVRKLARSKQDDAIRIVTRDEAHRQWFETTSHKLDRFTLRFFRRLLELIEGCGAAAERLRLPMLVLYAANDLFIPPRQVEDFFARLPGPDKESCLFPESYHLLLHDLDQKLVLARIENWLLPRVAAEPAGLNGSRH